MGATYTRQSSSGIVDGGVIEASDLNNEFDQLLAAFAVTTGHSHDGTAAEGGPVTKLLGTAITVGDATAGTDITVTFDGESNDGIMKWMEDEDYFEFSDDLLVSSTEKLQFRDTAIYLNSSTDGQLDIVADTEIQIAATTIDINGAVALDGAITGATNITLSGELDAATLDISGNADIDGTLEADAITVDGVALATFIRDTVGTNMISSNTESGITVTYDTSNDNIDFSVDAAQTGITSLLATDIKIGEDDQTKIDFETADEIHFFAANVEQVYLADNIFGPQSDSDVDLGTTGVRWKDAYIDTITTTGAITASGVVTGTGFTAGSAVIAESELELLDGLTAGTAIASKVVTTDASIDTSGQRNLTITGELDAASLDISGNADIDGTLEADAITIDGATLAETIADTVGAMVTSNTESGITVAYQDGDNTLDFTVGTLNQDTTGTAAIATTVTITDNESTNESNALIFTAGGDVDGGNLGLESDGTLTYNPSTGKVTATGFIGTLEGNVTGNVTGNTSGTAATVTTAAQTNITSLGTLTALTVDDVAVNGKVVTMTGSASDTAVFTAGTNGTLSIVTTDAAAAAANIQITADGTVDIDSAGVLTLDSGAAINIEPASGSAILLDGTISIDAGVVTGATSITSTAFVGDITGDVTGNTSGTAATVTTAAQSNITSLGTLTTLTVDNVIINGTTIGHTSDNDLMTLGSAILTVAGEVQMTTLDIGGTNVTSTAAELNYSDLATLGTTAASKVFSADANNLTAISGAVVLTEDTLTFDATQDWDVRASPVAKVTLTANVTFDAPTNPTTGQYIAIVCIQDGTGSRTIAWNAIFEFTGDAAPTATTTAAKGDMFTFRYNGSKWLEVGRNLNLTLS